MLFKVIVYSEKYITYKIEAKTVSEAENKALMGEYEEFITDITTKESEVIEIKKI